MVQAESPETDGVLMPDGYRIVKEWEAAEVEAVAEDCKMFQSSEVGSTVVFPGNMLVCVEFSGQKHHFVQENYIVCKA